MRHRFSLPDGSLTTYDTYPDKSLPDGRPLGWWFAIRIAWPDAIYPSPDHLMQKMVRLHRPMQLPIENSVAAAGIWRNLLMGSRAERSLDLERLRDAPHAADVAREEVAREPDRRVVREPHDLLLRLEARERGERPERLLRVHERVRRHVREHGRREERANAGKTFAPKQELCTTRERIIDMSLDLLDGAFVNQRAMSAVNGRNELRARRPYSVKLHTYPCQDHFRP